MTDGWVLKALRSRTKSLSLDNHVKVLPPSVGKLDFLLSLSVKNNRLQSLPPEIAALKSVSRACRSLVI